jgi:hypothetical protein
MGTKENHVYPSSVGLNWYRGRKNTDWNGADFPWPHHDGLIPVQIVNTCEYVIKSCSFVSIIEMVLI